MIISFRGSKQRRPPSPVSEEDIDHKWAKISSVMDTFENNFAQPNTK